MHNAPILRYVSSCSYVCQATLCYLVGKLRFKRAIALVGLDVISINADKFKFKFLAQR